jgi:selenocysteine-specific elongation factor
MYVVATAGHVDHGKSTLVRALTGMEPDRWAEERRRGMTIDLGYAWMALPGGEKLAFVDVPGHERFVPNMLAGLGPVPAVLFVVAADGGWMPQSAEHLAAVDALAVRHGLLVVTRADLADPAPATRAARAEIAKTSLGTVEAVPVSAVTGAGMDDLRAALVRLVATLGGSRMDSPVRLWIDRSFTIRGAGTVVTGTLPAGAVANGHELLLTPAAQPVRVRGLQALGEPAERVAGPARVALNLRGVAAGVPQRGMALIDPGRWTLTAELDVRVTPSASGLPDKFPPDLVLHIGSARTQARVRLLGEDPADAPGDGLAGSSPTDPPGTSPAGAPDDGLAGDGPHGAADGVAGSGSPGRGGPRAVYARLRLRDQLPLHAGDRVLLRDPGSAGLAIYGALILDPAPPPLGRRGAGTAAARELSGWPDTPTAADLLRRHRLLRTSTLAAMGVTELPAPVAADWHADPAHWAWLRAELPRVVAEFLAKDELAIGMPLDAARAALNLPTRDLLTPLITAPPAPAPPPGTAAPASPPGTAAPASPASPPAGRVVVDGGYLRIAVPERGPSRGKPAAPYGEPAITSTPAPAVALPPRVVSAVQTVLGDLAADPFAAPDAERLRELGLDARALAAAARAGLLLRIADLLVLAPGADKEAARLLSELPQPFTTSQARQALGTSRRVAIPLLEYLDRARVTERLPGDLRRLRPPAPTSAS